MNAYIYVFLVVLGLRNSTNHMNKLGWRAYMNAYIYVFLVVLGRRNSTNHVNKLGWCEKDSM